MVDDKPGGAVGEERTTRMTSSPEQGQWGIVG